MNRIMLAGLLSVLAAGAQAQAITGGEVGLAYDRNITHDRSQATLGGSLEFGLAGGLGLQADMAAHSRGATTDQVSAGGHLVYAFGPQGAVGGFLTYENWSGTFHAYTYGVEGRFSTQGATPLTVEGFLLRSARDKGQSDLDGVGLEGSLAVSDLSSLKAGVFSSGGATDLTRVSFGLGYELTPTLDLGLKAQRITSPGHHDNVVGVSLDYRFGSGATFGRRGIADLVPGF